LPIVVSGAFYDGGRAFSSVNAAPIDFSLEYGGISTCPLHFSRRIGSVAACAGANVGIISTAGSADGNVLERHRFLANVDVSVQGALNLGRNFFVALTPTLLVPVVRDSFDYHWNSGYDRVFRMSPGAFAADLGLGFRTP
jgi:hypothetical protein